VKNQPVGCNHEAPNTVFGFTTDPSSRVDARHDLLSLAELRGHDVVGARAVAGRAIALARPARRPARRPSWRRDVK
jgi:hypothetical protein